MVEHLVCNQAVVGSNPVASTRRLEPRRSTMGKGVIHGAHALRAEIFENKVNWNCGNYDEQERG